MGGFLLAVAPVPPVLRLFWSKNSSADVFVNQYAKWALSSSICKKKCSYVVETSMFLVNYKQAATPLHKMIREHTTIYQ